MPVPPVTDNGQIAITGGLRRDLLDGANDPRLRRAGRLLTPDALLRMSKESIGRLFEFFLCKVTRRRSIVLTEIVDDAVAAKREPISE